MKSILNYGTLFLYSSLLFAGGSDYTININSFMQTSKTEYILVLKPILNIQYSQSYLKKCETFTIYGTYNKKRAEEVYSLDMENYLEAMTYLNNNIGKKISFGYIGTGYKKITKNDPCVVKSNGLELANDGFRSAVLSYF